MAASKAKNILIVTAIAFGGLWLFGQKKLNTAKEVMDHIKVGVKSISNIKFSLKEISFNAVLTLHNQTKIDFGATLTSKIIIKQIRVYTTNGQYLGKADVNIYKLDLPANTVVELPNIPFRVATEKALETLANNVDLSTLKYKIDVEVFGNILTLDA